MTTVCLLLLAQTATVPVGWAGPWKLNVQKSTFGAILFPGAPAGFKIVTQTLTIEQTGSDIRLSGETVFSDNGGSHTSHDDIRLKLDGTSTNVGPGSLSFRRIGASTFDLISSLSTPNQSVGEVSRYAFSSDGTRLIETKTQTEREAGPEGMDKSAGRVIRTSKFVLVFSKSSER